MFRHFMDKNDCESFEFLIGDNNRLGDKLLPYGVLPVEVFFTSFDSSDGKETKCVSARKWKSIFDKEQFFKIQDNIFDVLTDDNIVGMDLLKDGIMTSILYLRLYSEILKANDEQDNKYDIFTYVISSSEKNHPVKKALLKWTSAVNIANDMMWENFTIERRKADRQFVTSSSHQLNKVTHLALRVIEKGESDRDENFLYFTVPGTSERILGSYSFFRYWKEKYPYERLGEVTVGKDLSTSSRKDGRVSDAHSRLQIRDIFSGEAPF